MLTARQLDVLPEPILALYERYAQSVLNDIARRLAGLDFARPTAAWQLQRLTESGRIYEHALSELATLTGQSEATLRRVFSEAGVEAVRFDDSIYRAAGLDPLPLNLSPAMVSVLRAGLERTNGLIRNLTQSTALTAQQAFIDAADLAFMQVSSGAMSHQQAVRAAIKDVAGKGLSVIHYASGRRDQLDVALRRAVLTGVNQTAGQLTEARANEMGADLVQTSAHIGARPSHAAWQGKVFSRSGQSDKYPHFATATGYGTATGLCGINCRHSYYPFFEGLSAEHYRQAEIDAYERKRVTFNGEEMSVYDATQKQRAIERNIRATKREIAALDAAGLDSTEERTQLYEDQREMRSFVRQTKLQRQRFREQAHELDKQPKALRPRQ